MEGEYSQEWAELRMLRREMFRDAAVGAVILVAVPPVTASVSLRAAKVIGRVFFAGWVVLLLMFFFVGRPDATWSLLLTLFLTWRHKSNLRRIFSGPGRLTVDRQPSTQRSSVAAPAGANRE